MRSPSSTSRRANVWGTMQQAAEGTLDPLASFDVELWILRERLVQLVEDGALSHRVDDERLVPADERGPRFEIGHRLFGRDRELACGGERSGMAGSLAFATGDVAPWRER